MPLQAGTGRTFIPLIHAPHADLPVPVWGGAEAAPVHFAGKTAKQLPGEVASWI